MKVYKVYNRKSKQLEAEVSGNINGLTFLYRSVAGKVLNPFVSRHFVSRAYAKYVKSRQSASQIRSFIKRYRIEVTEIELPPESYTSLNKFFIRKLKPSARKVDMEPTHLISPADARLIVFNLSEYNALPVKGYWYSLEKFVKDKELAIQYTDGWCYVYRLAPCDYHRFCYIDSGMQDEVRRIKGVLHSVNPIALSARKSLMARNYRELTLLHTMNFGKVLHFEVGAMMVGKVVLHNRKSSSFKRGEEKGWFEFGGSTIVQLFKKDAVKPDLEILEQSANRVETLIKMGEKVGCK